MSKVAHLITLNETKDREARAVAQLEEARVKYRVHKFDRHQIGWKGCIESHLEVYRRNITEPYILVCEDNIQIADKTRILKHLHDPNSDLNRFLQTPLWGIIIIGGYILRPWDYCQKTEFPSIYETRNNNHGTVAYIIHSRLYKEILRLNDISPINVHFDIFISGYTTHIYNPLLFYHASNLQSNINQRSDVWRKVWFHPKVMSIHEYIFFNRRKSLIFLCIILGGLWWILMSSRKNVLKNDHS